jgi:NodT family efflux transporter outer membrane factor (OMF) lipoprotein
VARTFVRIRTLEERMKIARENIVIQARSLEIATVRYRGGDVTELDVAQARTLLANTQASVPRLEAQVRQAENALALLLGSYPAQVREMLKPRGGIPSAPLEVAVGIPADTLRRRPDIRQAERRLMAQSERIGVAQADLYPHFSLAGSIGLRSSDASPTAAGFPGGSSLGDLWSANSLEYFAGPAFSWDLFNYGRIRNRIRVEDARFQQLAVGYRNAVLRAAREVEDATTGYLRSQEQARFLEESEAAASRSVELAMIQYTEGLADFQRVLDTQRALVAQQDQLTANRGEVVLNLVALYKALGGGWEFRQGKPFVPEDIRREMAERTDWGGLLEPGSVEETAAETEGPRWRSPDW